MTTTRVKPAKAIVEKEALKRRREFIESLYRPFRAVKIRARKLAAGSSTAQSMSQAIELAMDAAMAQIDDLVEEFSTEIDAFAGANNGLVAPLKKELEDSAEQLHAENAHSALSSLMHAFNACQKIRIALTNKCNATVNGRARSAVAISPLASLAVQFGLMEEELISYAAKELARHPAGEFLAGIRGVGPLTAGRVVGLIPMFDANSFTTFSKLRAYAGLAPGRDKLVKNQQARFNVQLRTALHICWATWQQLYHTKRLDPQGHYMNIYLKWEQHYEQTKPDWTKKHRMLAARRKCLDVFLHHIWYSWRTKQGWPIRDLYVHERLNHETVYRPEDFWDADLAKKNLKRWAAGKLN